MFNSFVLLFLLPFVRTSEAPRQGLFETSGFHCIYRNSMELPRHLHGQPQSSDPPFELSVVDSAGRRAESYVPGMVYTVKLLGYVHYRGFMLQPRLCTPRGELIGHLRGGSFRDDDRNSASAGYSFQNCDASGSNDSITHWSDDKKFAVEVPWSTNVDVGDVQLMATVASENDMYWEKWRPRSGYLRSPTSPPSQNPNPNFFVYSLLKEEIFAKEVTPDLHPLFEGPKQNDVKVQASLAESEDEIFSVNASIFDSHESSGESEPQVRDVLESINSDVTPLPVPSPEEPDVLRKFAAERMFKKFQPSRDTRLASDDLKFLNAHTQLQHDFVDNDVDSSEEKCVGVNPCSNNGRCVLREGKQTCECITGWVGDRCKQRDACQHHLCANNGTCANDSRSPFGYSCQCRNGTVGSYCQFECAADQCANGGSCIMKQNGEIGCKCQSGTTGPRCEREINECTWKKCLNGADCIDLFNDYQCVCSDGWMGRHCERPCRDAFGSCRVWKRDGECEVPREQTEFFAVNCAASCGVCTPSNQTDTSYLPLQPILMPFAWLLGEWKTHVKGWNNRTTDYPVDMQGMGYNETLTFAVSESLMFGTPHINYTSVLVNDEDPDNVHQHSGFLTIQQYKPEEQKRDRAALMTVSNTGTILVEEGELNQVTPDDVTLALDPHYVFQKDDAAPKLAVSKMRRWLSRKGIRLTQYIVREVKGRTHKFTKIYRKTNEFKYL